MVRAQFSHHGALYSAQEFGLVGLTDIKIVDSVGGPMLFAATRGNGWLSAYDIGKSAGQTTLAQQWHLAPGLLQLETTDLVLRSDGGTQELFMAGLNSANLTGVRLDHDGAGAAIAGSVSYSATGRNLSGLTEMELIGDGSTGIAAMRNGPLVNISFGPGNALNISNIYQGAEMQGAQATDIVTAQHNGQTYAFVTYRGEDTVSMFRQDSGGAMVHVGDATAGDGFWVDRPGALTLTSSADGKLYVVVAGSGSDSLTTFSVENDGMIPVDHLIDSLDTRFADASHVTSVTMGEHNFVLAAGSDSGVNVFTVLPGGRLQHVDAMPGSIDAPLRAITSIDAMATPDGIRMWVSTEAAPYLAEFSVSLPDLGISRGASAGGGTLNGTAQDDVLSGASGADQLIGGFGNDILLDGAGSDNLRGQGGRDTFVLVEDGARDVIQDFQLGLDRIDLTDFNQIGGLGSMTFTSRSWGGEFRVNTEVLEVRTEDGSRLYESDFNSANLLTGNRIQTDPGLYPESVRAARADPNPGSTENPSGIDPETLSPAWHNAPRISLDRQAGDNVVGAGSDMIQSGGQHDRIFGAGGNDTIQAGGGSDSISGEGGNDSIDGNGDDDLLLGAAGFDTINGGDGNDTISGDTFADSLNGGGGDDVILGGDGFDQIMGGDGNDSVWAGDAPDRIYGGDGNDWLSAGSNVGLSVDGVFGQGGNDTLFGNAGFDLLNGGDGDDLLDGGHQSDNLYGEDGNDTLLGSFGFDRLFGGRGDDQIFGGDAGDGIFGQEGNDTLWGGEGGDRFFGGTGNDTADGGTGNDTIYADAGFDTVIGGEGDDELYGGFNADEFVFSDGHGNDTIGEFDATNPTEVLNFSHLSGFSAFTDVMNAAVQTGSDVIIRTGGDSSVRLRNVNLEDLDENDFVF